MPTRDDAANVVKEDDSINEGSLQTAQVEELMKCATADRDLAMTFHKALLIGQRPHLFISASPPLATRQSRCGEELRTSGVPLVSMQRSRLKATLSILNLLSMTTKTITRISSSVTSRRHDTSAPTADAQASSLFLSGQR